MPEILHFPLSGLLPEGSRLALNPATRTLAVLSVRSGKPCLMADQQFAPYEMGVLQALLEAYPGHCPHEVLLAGLYGDRTHETRTLYRERLRAAKREDSLSREIKPLRNVFHRIRKKLRLLGMDVVSYQDQGYGLLVWNK
jgi:DNA-binding winged helix-turn-helix (wHTH) protein